MPKKKKRPDDAPVPASTEEQADQLEEENPPDAPSPDFVNPETAEDPADLVPEEPVEPEQQLLFGKADEIINVLETERSSVRFQIAKDWDAIAKKKSEIADLEKRQADIDKAIKTLQEKAEELGLGPDIPVGPEAAPIEEAPNTPSEQPEQTPAQIS